MINVFCYKVRLFTRNIASRYVQIRFTYFIELFEYNLYEL